MSPVLCLIAAQEASNEAWAAWLCNRPMTWLQGVGVAVSEPVSRRYKFGRRL